MSEIGHEIAKSIMDDLITERTMIEVMIRTDVNQALSNIAMNEKISVGDLIEKCLMAYLRERMNA